MKHNILLTFLLTFLVIPSFCQNNDLVEAKTQSVKNDYRKYHVRNILSGKTYSIKYLNAINSQFYKDVNPAEGSLFYDGVYFPLIEIQYDLYIQKVIVLLEAKNTSRYVSIDTEKVSRFSIGNVFFERVTNDSTMRKDIYELAFSGTNAKVLIKRVKKRKEKVIDDKIMYVFIEQDLYFVKNRFGSFQIFNKKSFLNAYENAAQVRSLLRSNNIKMSKKDFEKDLVKAVSFLESME